MRPGGRVPERRQDPDRCRVFAAEVARWERAIYPAALRLTHDHRDAEDLVQETMVRAYTGMRHFEPGTNGKAWLFRIMANTFVNTCRKRQREPVQVPSAEIDTALGAGAPAGSGASAPSAEAEVLDRLAFSDVRRALDQLPECFRATIYLADVEGYSYKDIAELTGVPIGTVMSRLSRARGKLRALLADPAGRPDGRPASRPQATSSASPVNAAHIAA